MSRDTWGSDDRPDTRLVAKDIAALRRGLDQIEAGVVGTEAAQIRYLAALVSRAAVRSGLPRETSCRWDVTDAGSEAAAVQRGAEANDQPDRHVLVDSETNEDLRPATADEAAESFAAGETGHILTSYMGAARRCYVEVR